MEFNSLSLPEELKRALAESGYISAMPVQEKVIELGLDGRDLYVQSQTGTGKTAAFLLVVFHRLCTSPDLAGRSALIMVPTRELAVQVEEEAKLLGKYLPYKIGSFYGGVGYGEQHKLLRNDAQILIGTPGRVLDLNAAGEMNLMNLAFLVLDEADRMFDMGFYPDLRKILKVVPPPDRRQTMLFSATLNVYVKNLALEYTKEPLEIEIEPEHMTVEEIDQVLYHVPSEKKFSLLLGILQREQPESAIIFCNTKRYTEVVARRLRANGVKCEFISGDLPQKKRLALIEDLKAGKYRYLAATDVAARGLDVEALAMVVNYDLPTDTENYVHRIGRTARAGADGKAISFASEQDVYELADIEKYIGKKIPAEIAGEDSYGEDKGHNRVGEGRREYRGGEKRGDRGDNRRSGQNTHGGRRSDNRQPPQRKSDPKQHENLAGMSFEERVAYHKQKHEADAQETAQNRTGNNKRRRKRGGRQTNRQDASRAPQKTQNQGQSSGRQKPRAEAGKHPASGKPAGLFSRIAALFTRKK